YRLEAGTSRTKLVISHAYVQETLSSGAKAHRGRGAFLKGAAIDKGDGKVGLPVAGAGVAFAVGDKVTVAGTTGYNGVHAIAEGTTAIELVIEASFTSETFDGTASAIPLFYRHSFKLPKVQPTVSLQKHFNFDEGAADEPYSLFQSCKVNSYSFSFGGEQEIQFAIDWSMGSHEMRASSLNASLEPKDLPQSGWADKETAIWMDGVRLGDVQSGSITQSFNIEAVAAVGDMGKRYRQSEGDPTCDVSFTAFLEEDKYQQLADASAKVSVDISMDNAAGDELWLHVYEAELDSSGPQITGKTGLTQDFTAMGYVDSGETLCGYTLINRVESYA
ncbi:MAG: phage tail tube protein, partial [Mailhella sp.]